MGKETCHQLIPSRVEGRPDVSQINFYPDRLELISDGHRCVVRFADIAKWPRPRWLWRAMYSVGVRPRWLPVADRDWFHGPRDRFFAFYTDPPLRIFMPLDEPTEYNVSNFWRVQRVLLSGGFHTFDLG